MNLDRHSPVPLYHQLKILILNEIEAGLWATDQQLPTEKQLAEQFKVSKITVRQALRELALLGRVRREQGRGTYVQKPALEEGPRKLTSFSNELRERGSIASSEVLDKSLIAAPAVVAGKLGIVEGELIFRLRRLRLADGIPMGVQVAHLPAALVPGIEDVPFEDASLYDILGSRFGLHPASATETLVAVVVTNQEASLLRIPPGSPALAAQRVTLLSNGQRLEYAESIMRGDRHKVVLDLVRQP